MEYDRQGHLSWVNEGARAWVGSKAGGPAETDGAAPTATADLGKRQPPAATPPTDGGRAAHRLTLLKRALLVAIVVLIVTNVALLLTALGVFRGL
jgi:hypothetical protein